MDIYKVQKGTICPEKCQIVAQRNLNCMSLPLCYLLGGEANFQMKIENAKSGQPGLKMAQNATDMQTTHTWSALFAAPKSFRK